MPTIGIRAVRSGSARAENDFSTASVVTDQKKTCEWLSSEMSTSLSSWKSIFDTGIAETHALGRTLSFEDFKTVVKIVLRKDIADRLHIDYYKGVALHEWLKVNEEKENQEQF